MSREAVELHTLDLMITNAYATEALDRIKSIKTDSIQAAIEQVSRDFKRGENPERFLTIYGKTIQSITGSAETQETEIPAILWLSFKNGAATNPSEADKVAFNEEKASFDAVVNTNSEKSITELHAIYLAEREKAGKKDEAHAFIALLKLAQLHNQSHLTLVYMWLAQAFLDTPELVATPKTRTLDVTKNENGFVVYAVTHDINIKKNPVDPEDKTSLSMGKAYYVLTASEEGPSISRIKMESKALCDFLNNLNKTSDAKIKFFTDLFNESQEKFETKKEYLIGLMQKYPEQKNIFYAVLIDLCIAHIETLKTEYEARSPIKALSNTSEKKVAAIMAVNKLRTLKEELQDSITPASPVTKGDFKPAAQKDRLGEIISAFLEANEIASPPTSGAASPGSPGPRHH